MSKSSRLASKRANYAERLLTPPEEDEVPAVAPEPEHILAVEEGTADQPTTKKRGEQERSAATQSSSTAKEEAVQYDQVRPAEEEAQNEQRVLPNTEAPSIRDRITQRAKPESRSVRLHVIIKPSMDERVRAQAKKEGLSVNELFNLILEQALDELERE